MVYISHDILDCSHRPCRVTVVPPDPRELMVWMVLMVDKDDQEIKYVKYCEYQVPGNASCFFSSLQGAVGPPGPNGPRGRIGSPGLPVS